MIGLHAPNIEIKTESVKKSLVSHTVNTSDTIESDTHAILSI